jgi:hypothetical protein
MPHQPTIHHTLRCAHGRPSDPIRSSEPRTSYLAWLIPWHTTLPHTVCSQSQPVLHHTRTGYATTTRDNAHAITRTRHNPPCPHHNAPPPRARAHQATAMHGPYSTQHRPTSTPHLHMAKGHLSHNNTQAMSNVYYHIVWPLACRAAEGASADSLR